MGICVKITRESFWRKIETGLSTVIIIVPQGTAARLIVTGGLTDVKLSDAWELAEGKYISPGEGATLSFRVQMGAGNLQLCNR